ncbi:MAG: threonine-phosphate decarboxylase CobD [Halanaerobium sp.]
MEHQHGGRLKQAAAANNLQPEEIIDFSANINFLGPPEQIIKAVRNNAAQIKNYPEINSKNLKKLIAVHHQLEPEKVTVANGAAEMIYQLTKVLQPQKVMVIVPTFSEYELAAESVGAEIVHFQLQKETDFLLNLEKLESELSRKIDLLFICNPNNPTGQLIRASALEQLIKKAAAAGVRIVIDEAFNDFLENGQKYSAVNFLKKYDNLVILKSMTKLFAIPGLRLGYALTNKNLSFKLENKRDPWSVNYYAQLAGEIIFAGSEEIAEYVKKSRNRTAREREYLFSSLKKIKCLKVYQPSVNFIFIDLSACSYTAAELKSALLREAILIRNCDSYQGLQDNYIRVAVKSREANKILIEKLNLLLD